MTRVIIRTVPDRHKRDLRILYGTIKLCLTWAQFVIRNPLHVGYCRLDVSIIDDKRESNIRCVSQAVVPKAIGTVGDRLHRYLVAGLR